MSEKFRLLAYGTPPVAGRALGDEDGLLIRGVLHMVRLATRWEWALRHGTALRHRDVREHVAAISREAAAGERAERVREREHRSWYRQERSAAVVQRQAEAGTRAAEVFRSPARRRRT